MSHEVNFFDPPITRISDVDLKDSSTVTAIDNIEGCAESAGVRINFMKS